jgi:hypothetical protein
MILKEKIQQDLKKALSGGDTISLSTLRMLSAALLNKEKEKRYKLKKEQDISLTDEEIVEVVVSEVKKRKEAIFEFEKGGRQDLVEKEKRELEVLMRYLPEQLSEEEIKKLVKEAVEKTGAKSIKDMAKVMAELMPKVKGRADGAQVSKIVKTFLEHA